MSGTLIVVERRREDAGIDWEPLPGKSTFKPDELEAAIARGTVEGWSNHLCEYRITIYRRDPRSVAAWKEAKSFDEVRIALTKLLGEQLALAVDWG